jgi:hypothetical protein
MHDPNNKDCEWNYHNVHIRDGAPCTCPPAVDEVEQIRARHIKNAEYLGVADYGACMREIEHNDRATLLRIIDRDRSIMPEVAALIEIIDAMAEGNASAYSVIVRQKSLKAALKEIGR